MSNWGGRRPGAGRPVSSMAGITPPLLRTARALPGALGIELLYALRKALVRVEQAGSGRREMVARIVAGLREATEGGRVRPPK